MDSCTTTCNCRGTFGCCSRGLSKEESQLLNEPLPFDLDQETNLKTWKGYQATIDRLLIRMGRESSMLETFARMVLVRNLGGIRARLALLPTLGRSAMNAVQKHGLSEITFRLAGEFCLMELSAAAGYRTFCLPNLVRGLLKTGKMKDQPLHRMIDTFEFLKTMFQHPPTELTFHHQLARTNELHKKYKVAGAANEAARDLFRYIGLNMFYVGPSMRQDLTPQERHAICGITVLAAEKMGHRLEGSVKQFEDFIFAFELSEMFDCADEGNLRKRAVEIAQASKLALREIPTISPERIHGYVPHRVKRILEI